MFIQRTVVLPLQFPFVPMQFDGLLLIKLSFLWGIHSHPYQAMCP